MTIEVNSGPRWTDEDETKHIAWMKEDLVALLKNDETFAALDNVALSTPMITTEDCALVRLRIAVCGLRDELIAWVEGN